MLLVFIVWATGGNDENNRNSRLYGPFKTKDAAMKEAIRIYEDEEASVSVHRLSDALPFVVPK
jgi:hypothetical protein